MIQTENTAIVLRYVNYRDNDRMVTLLSPSRGRIDAVIRNCRKPKSHNLNAGEMFALGDYMLHEANGRAAVTSVKLIETFYPLRNDYNRLICGTWLLNLAEAAAEPEQEQRELFMLLLHTLSRLAFSDQEWKPLLTGFLLHFSACEGFKPRLNHCVHCGSAIGEEDGWFDIEEGGACCGACRGKASRGVKPLKARELLWLRAAIKSGSASWVNSGGMQAPFDLMKEYVESRMGKRIRAGAMLPAE